MEKKRNDKINWIRAHILIFIIVPVQTYLFHLASNDDECIKKKRGKSIAWVRFPRAQKKNVIEMEKVLLITSPMCRDNTRYIKIQQSRYICNIMHISHCLRLPFYVCTYNLTYVLCLHNLQNSNKKTVINQFGNVSLFHKVECKSHSTQVLHVLQTVLICCQCSGNFTPATSAVL